MACTRPAKGKAFSASLPDFSDDENDREVEGILDKSPPKRCVHEAAMSDQDSDNEDKTKYTKRRETLPSTPARSTKSANAIGKRFVFTLVHEVFPLKLCDIRLSTLE